MWQGQEDRNFKQTVCVIPDISISGQSGALNTFPLTFQLPEQLCDQAHVGFVTQIPSHMAFDLEVVVLLYRKGDRRML